MSFPATVSASASSAEQPGKFAIFVNGTNRYQVQLLTLDPVGQTANLAVFKSTDLGVTWIEKDAANEKIAQYNGANSSVPYTCCKVGTKIYVIFFAPPFNASITSFDMATDLWTALSVNTAAPPFGSYQSGAETSTPLGQYCCSSRPTTGDIIFVLAGDQTTGLGALQHVICCFAVFNIAGGTWGAWTDLGFLDYADVTSWDQVPCGIVTDVTSGRTTVFMQQISVTLNNIHNSRIYQQSISSTNVVGTLTEITSGQSLPRNTASIPIAFDCAIDSAGNIAICFTGAVSTTGVTNIAVGQGTTANPVIFTVANIASGNTINDGSPCVCIGAGPVYYCCYISVGINFYFRSDSGSGFGGATSMGTIGGSDPRAFGRLQCALILTLPEITFSTPTAALRAYLAPG